jgi:uncharacterized protein (TIGR03066 family)
MKLVKFGALAGVLCVLAGVSTAQDKVDYTKMIVGKWQVSKADAGTVPEGPLIEFTKDGKMKIKGKKGEEELTREGKYKVKDNTFTMSLDIGGETKSRTITITKISKTAMSTKDEDGKEVELTREKAKDKKKGKKKDN